MAKLKSKFFNNRDVSFVNDVTGACALAILIVPCTGVAPMTHLPLFPLLLDAVLVGGGGGGGIGGDRLSRARWLESW